MGKCNHNHNHQNNIMFLLPLIIIISLFFSPSDSISSTAGKKLNKLVDSICNQTPNHKFCVDAIYTDPRASEADIILLAYISFGLAYTNATNILSFITDHHLLVDNQKNGSHGSPALAEGLKQCSLDYKKAVTALEVALNDLDSDTYDLEESAGVLAQSAVHCEHSLKPTMTISSSLHSQLTRRNRDLKLLGGICSVISSRLFN